MGFFSMLFERKGGGSIDSSLELFREIYGGRPSASGVVVNLDAAIRCTAAMACARVIATSLAQVPFKLFRKDPEGARSLASDHPLYQVLCKKPNPWQTPYSMFETMGLHLAFCGRAYFFKVMVRGQLRELIPFAPGRVTVKLADDGIGLLYEVTGKGGDTRTFDSSLIWHVRGPSWNGWEGLDPMVIAREAIGLSVLTESKHARMSKNGIATSGTYSIEGKLDEKQYKDLRQWLALNHAGENDGLPMILDRGAKWLQQQMSGVDLQLLETRRHQAVEVCRAMGVMPIMVFADDKTQAFASVEALYQAHDMHTSMPWWRRVEMSIDCDVLTAADTAAGYYGKFVSSGLLRASAKDRADYFAKALGAGGSPAWMTQDEVRANEEMNPMGGAAAVLPVPTNVAKPAPANAVAGE